MSFIQDENGKYRSTRVLPNPTPTSKIKKSAFLKLLDKKGFMPCQQLLSTLLMEATISAAGKHGTWGL